jgi:hypothetical protein
MADLSKQHQNLTVLQLSMEYSVVAPNNSRVVFMIKTADETKLRTETEPAALGLPINLREVLQSDNSFRSIPKSIIQDIQREIDKAIDKPTSLWLEFASPSGNLPLLPWERMLQSSLNVSLLRLSYFELQPISSPSALNIVLCASIPTTSSKLVAKRLDTFIQQILASLEEDVIIHVFTNEELYLTLQETFPERLVSTNRGVKLYNPKEAPFPGETGQSYSDHPASKLESSWLHWIKTALFKRSADVVHFLCHGHLSMDGGAMAVSESPLFSKERQRVKYINFQQLTTFLTEIGAWSVGFSSALSNSLNSGLRLLADEVSRLRPGPVFLHDTTQDRGSEILGEIYRFLYSEKPQAPPASPAVSIYSHPNRLDRNRSEINNGKSLDILQQYTLAKGGTHQILQSKENTPVWIASSQRYLEQLAEESVHKASELNSSSPSYRGTEEALRMISNLIEKSAKDRF